jgi:hypothetical protein
LWFDHHFQPRSINESTIRLFWSLPFQPLFFFAESCMSHYFFKSRLPQIWSIWLPRIPTWARYSPNFWYLRSGTPGNKKKAKSILSRNF